MKGAASRWVLRLATEIPSSGLPERTDAQERLQPTPCCDQFRLSRDVRKNSLSLALSVSTRDRASFYTVSRMYGGIGLTTASLLLLTVYILSCRRLHIYPKFLILLIFPPSCYLLYPFFWVIPRRLNFICRRFGTLCLFHLYRQVVVWRMNWVCECWSIIRERVWLENSLSHKEGGWQGRGGVRVQKQAVEGNDPHGGHGQVCEGEGGVKLLCFRWLSLFLKLV